MKTFKFKIYPLEPPIEIRRAKKNDKLMQIAELIYCSNPKLFKYYHYNQVYGCEDLVNMILTKGSALYFENMFVAAQGSKIWGVLVALTPKTDLSYNYKYFKKKREPYKVTVENYFEKMPEKLKNGTFLVTNLFVHEAYRNFTIARKLIISAESYFKEQGINYTEVYVLSDNDLLKNLVKNMEFKQVDKYLDFATADEKQYVETYRRQIKEDEYYK